MSDVIETKGDTWYYIQGMDRAQSLFAPADPNDNNLKLGLLMQDIKCKNLLPDAPQPSGAAYGTPTRREEMFVTNQIYGDTTGLSFEQFADTTLDPFIAKSPLSLGDCMYNWLFPWRTGLITTMIGRLWLALGGHKGFKNLFDDDQLNSFSAQTPFFFGLPNQYVLPAFPEFPSPYVSIFIDKLLMTPELYAVPAGAQGTYSYGRITYSRLTFASFKAEQSRLQALGWQVDAFESNPGSYRQARTSDPATYADYRLGKMSPSFVFANSLANDLTYRDNIFSVWEGQVLNEGIVFDPVSFSQTWGSVHSDADQGNQYRVLMQLLVMSCASAAELTALFSTDKYLGTRSVFAAFLRARFGNSVIQNLAISWYAELFGTIPGTQWVLCRWENLPRAIMEYLIEKDQMSEWVFLTPYNPNTLQTKSGVAPLIGAMDFASWAADPWKTMGWGTYPLYMTAVTSECCLEVSSGLSFGDLLSFFEPFLIMMAVSQIANMLAPAQLAAAGGQAVAVMPGSLTAEQAAAFMQRTGFQAFMGSTGIEIVAASVSAPAWAMASSLITTQMITSVVAAAIAANPPAETKPPEAQKPPETPPAEEPMGPPEPPPAETGAGAAAGGGTGTGTAVGAGGVAAGAGGLSTGIPVLDTILTNPIIQDVILPYALSGGLGGDSSGQVTDGVIVTGGEDTSGVNVPITPISAGGSAGMMLLLVGAGLFGLSFLFKDKPKPKPEVKEAAKA